MATTVISIGTLEKIYIGLPSQSTRLNVKLQVILNKIYYYSILPSCGIFDNATTSDFIFTQRFVFAADLMDGLRQIPGREAIKLRAEVSLTFFFSPSVLASLQ